MTVSTGIDCSLSFTNHLLSSSFHGFTTRDGTSGKEREREGRGEEGEGVGRGERRGSGREGGTRVYREEKGIYISTVVWSAPSHLSASMTILRATSPLSLRLSHQ